MRSTRGAFWALAMLGGFLIWRNRFAIQRQLESMGVRTPLLGGDMNFGENIKSAVSKVSGRFDKNVNEMSQAVSGTDRNVGNI